MDIDETPPHAPAENPYRARVEEVPDEGDEVVWVQEHPKVGEQVLGMGECTFERWRREARETGKSHWAPYTQREWKLQRWLSKNAGQNQIDEFLKLDIVSIAYHL